MVPLYATRVQDLGPGDVAVFKCGACVHATAIPLGDLVHGLRLPPTERVLDLALRLRCRGCDEGEGCGVCEVASSKVA
jgi:hypothetical protein